jgi:hypothetical protein
VLCGCVDLLAVIARARANLRYGRRGITPFLAAVADKPAIPVKAVLGIGKTKGLRLST